MGFNPGPIESLKEADKYNLFGYYENLPLLRISRNILSKFGGDIVRNIPDLPNGWLNELDVEKQQILDTVHSGNIEITKDPSLTVIAGLYHELFPKAKWIVIQRDINETYKSRFGMELTFQEWVSITNRRLEKWQQTIPFSKALHLAYKDFAVDFQGIIQRISSFLGVELTASQMKECFEFYKPGQRNQS